MTGHSLDVEASATAPVFNGSCYISPWQPARYYGSAMPAANHIFEPVYNDTIAKEFVTDAQMDFDDQVMEPTSATYYSPAAACEPTTRIGAVANEQQQALLLQRQTNCSTDVPAVTMTSRVVPNEQHASITQQSPSPSTYVPAAPTTIQEHLPPPSWSYPSRPQVQTQHGGQCENFGYAVTRNASYPTDYDAGNSPQPASDHTGVCQWYPWMREQRLQLDKESPGSDSLNDPQGKDVTKKRRPPAGPFVCPPPLDRARVDHRAIHKFRRHPPFLVFLVHNRATGAEHAYASAYSPIPPRPHSGGWGGGDTLIYIRGHLKGAPDIH